MRWILLALALGGVAAPEQVPELVQVSGTVEAVRDNGLDGCGLCDACNDCQGVHLLVRARSGRIEVHLAPAWFLDRLEFAPAVGDLISMSGTRVRMPTGRGLTAHEVQSGSTVIKLRDEYGLPLWRRLLTDARGTDCEWTGR